MPATVRLRRAGSRSLAAIGKFDGVRGRSYWMKYWGEVRKANPKMRETVVRREWRSQIMTESDRTVVSPTPSARLPLFVDSGIN